MSFRHQCELAYVRREVDVLRAELDELRELRASRLAVENAEQEVAELRRSEHGAELGTLINRDCSAIAGCRKRRVRIALDAQAIFLRSPPAEKATARQYQAHRARQTSADDASSADSRLIVLPRQFGRVSDAQYPPHPAPMIAASSQGTGENG
jgi:hypothetical protein